MKNRILLLLLFISTTMLHAQEKVVIIKPKEEKPKAAPVKTKKVPVKTKIVYVDRPSTTDAVPKASIKFLCDSNAILFIDGEKKGILKIDTPFRVNLPQGEYIIKVVNPKDENDFLKWNYTVNEIGVEKLEEIRFKKSLGTNKQSTQKETSKSKVIKTDLEVAHLLGKIKSTTTNTYLVNKKKSVIEKGKLLTSIVVLYDEKGFMKEFSYDKKKTIYNHDDLGKLTTSMNYESTSSTAKSIASGLAFGLVGLAVKAIANSGKDKSLGNLISKTSYDYNINNKLIGASTYTEKGKLTSRSVLKRDENGRLFENKSYDENNNLVSTVVYDENEHFKEIYQFNDKGAQINKFLYSWDENNNNTEMEYYQEGKLTMKTSSIYDNRNHVIQTSTLMPNINTTPTVVKLINEYDGNDNLIKTTNDTTIVEVVIEYY